MTASLKAVDGSADLPALMADIAALEFTDPQHGKLTTSPGEVWVTIDAGAVGRLEVRCSRETAARSAEFERLRREILGLVAAAGPKRS